MTAWLTGILALLGAWGPARVDTDQPGNGECAVDAQGVSR